MRQLRIPLQRAPVPRAGGMLADWAQAARTSDQPCLLVGVDGALVALSERARALLGETARPGLPQRHWWLERFPHSSAPEREQSLLSRAAASGTPAHSVVQLVLAERPAMVQVLVAPLDDAAGVTRALLVFLRPVNDTVPAR